MIRFGLVSAMVLAAAAVYGQVQIGDRPMAPAAQPEMTVRADEVSNPQASRLVEAYFNRLRTFKAGFTQRTDGEAFAQEGMFYLDRTGSNPGKFLWDYQTPDKQRLVATGTALYFIDDENGSAATQLPVKAGLARLFAGKTLNLAQEGLQVTDARVRGDEMEVDLKVSGDLGGDDTSGVQQVRLVFDRDPMVLQQVRVTDALNVNTYMTFRDIETGVRLDPALFKYTPANQRS